MTSFWSRRDFERALGIVEELTHDGSPEMRAEALFFGGIIKQDQGRLSDARSNWLDAMGLVDEGTFLLYQVQYNMGSSYQGEGQYDQALEWYRAAIRTCVAGEEFSCDQALTSLLALSREQILKDEEGEIARALEKSWNVLQLPGAPDLSDLPRSITRLNEGFSNLLAETEES